MRKLICIMISCILMASILGSCSPPEPLDKGIKDNNLKDGDMKDDGAGDKGENDDTDINEAGQDDQKEDTKSKIDITGLEKSTYDALDQSSDIKLSIKEQTIDRGDEKITLIYENLSSKEYIYGEEPHLEVNIDGDWYVMPLLDNVAWHDIGYILAEKGTREDIFTITNFYKSLGAGQYRLIKKLFPDEGEEVFAIAEFQVK
ncbi:MAG: hypothetical protein GX974_04645 [Clostridiales bacterium]|nr:hypothetical protein [Clostridiales bacterium]